MKTERQSEAAKGGSFSNAADSTGAYSNLPREACGGLHPRLLAAEVLCRHLPPFVGSRLRRAALIAAGVEIAAGVCFWGMPTLTGTGDIAARLSIGENCGFNVGSFFELAETISIGRDVSVGHGVMFLTRTYALGGAAQRAGRIQRAPIVIEPGVWLGARSLVMPGVTIGAGSVVGAAAVVTEDVPPNTLILGTLKTSLAKWR